MNVLSIRSVSLSFGGVFALDGVSLDVGQGEGLGIIGPNGAGKTTGLNVICGINRPDAGEVWLGDTEITGMKPNAIAARGLSRTFQISQLFPGMTVLENLMVGLHLRFRVGPFGVAL